MESRDIQIKELSEKTGISENTIKSYLKSDSAEPKVSKAVKIADALDVSVETLTGYEKPDMKLSSPELLELIKLSKQLSRTELDILISLAKNLKENIHHLISHDNN